VGATGKGIKESARMAYDYLKGNTAKMGTDRDISTFDTNIQVISLMQAKDADDRRITLPSENKRDFANLPAELLEKLMIDFYGDPTKPAYKAIVEGE
jgi:ATP-dependent Lon protease